MLHLPIELWLQVGAYLAPKDLKVLSSCSRHCRDAVLSHLFRNIKLSIASLAAFTGGRFSGLKNVVRAITFADLIPPVTKMWELSRTYCESLHLFPNVIALRIPYANIGRHNRIFLALMFCRIGKQGVYSNLRRFSIEASASSYIRNNEDFQAQPKLLKEEKEILQQMRDGSPPDPIPYPPSLEEATTSFLDATSFNLRHEFQKWENLEILDFRGFYMRFQ
ncbi:hypothetical protein ABW20_dc0109615 [Dactylellina cionopaga]|nr:hypothetical protein ABW20_dc0109615 [Dactylellina cionopaga]